MATLQQALSAYAERVWYEKQHVPLLLKPLSWLFAALVATRRWLYRRGLLQTVRLSVPVVVVGNITAGGTGKTPVTLWLVDWLVRQGFTPAVVSRGYGGSGASDTLRVTADTDPAIAGDEPVMLARRAGCLVFVNPDRVAAASAAIAADADVVIADDGLQHYRLGRDVEIAVVDGSRGLGNGWLLPAGPLREPPRRLAEVDRVFVQAEAGVAPRYGNREQDSATTVFTLDGDAAVNLVSGRKQPLMAFASRRVRAVAGIGNPERFFRLLERHGLTVVRHPFPDHAALTEKDVIFGDDAEVLMTEKDAVKCESFPHFRFWSVPVGLQWDNDGDANEAWLADLRDKLRRPS